MLRQAESHRVWCGIRPFFVTTCVPRVTSEIESTGRTAIRMGRSPVCGGWPHTVHSLAPIDHRAKTDMQTTHQASPQPPIPQNADDSSGFRLAVRQPERDLRLPELTT